MRLAGWAWLGLGWAAFWLEDGLSRFLRGREKNVGLGWRCELGWVIGVSERSGFAIEVGKASNRPVRGCCKNTCTSTQT
jgi:hypothetical protein